MTASAYRSFDIDEPTVDVSTRIVSIKSAGHTGELRVARTELGRLRAEMARLLDRVAKLEQGADKPAGPAPANGSSLPTVPRAQPQAIAPPPAPAVGGPKPTPNPPLPAPVRRPTPAPQSVLAAGRARPPQAKEAVPGRAAAAVSRPDAVRIHPVAGVRAPLAPSPQRRPSAPRQAPVGRPAAARTAERPPAAVPARPTTPAPVAASGLEAGYSAVLAEVLGVPTVPADSNFFDDLGADSMVMARFCARVRRRSELPNVAIKDIYGAPTIAMLAAAQAGAPAAANGQSAVVRTAPAVSSTPPAQGEEIPASPGPASGQVVEGGPRTARVGTFRYLLCGLLQLLFLLGYPALVSYAFAVGAEWVLTADGTLLQIYVRSVQVAGGLFLGIALVPILVKWLIVGRWKPTEFPLWSLRYFRFWLVKTLIRTNPLVRFVGTPLYPFYLRLLGARIGKGTTILSPTMPVCTDLLTIGAGTIIRKASSFTGYRAYAGMIQTGRVTIGSGALVGEGTVLDIDTSVGDNAQLGHTSALHAEQSVPAGEHWHGSPAMPTSVNYRIVPAASGGSLRRLAYSIVQLVMLFGVVLPLSIGGVALLVREVPQVQQLFVDAAAGAGQMPPLLAVAILATALLVGGLVLGLLVIAIVPRLLTLLVRPNRVYRLYGSAHWALRTITRISNSKFGTRVTGDSSFVVGYLRAVGYRFHKVEQTGSNFGIAVAHDNPFLCHVGTGTVVADGLTFLNADYSSNSFKVSPVRIGGHSFFGNMIFYPARARVGDDCLLATKVMVPVDGPVREGVGLLGSPSFEIPRSVDRDAKLAVGPEERRRGVQAKARHNLVTIGMLLLSRWVYLALALLLFRIALPLETQFGLSAIAVLGVAELLLTFVYFVLLDATVRWLAALRPQGVSIYDRAFWRHERYWKVAADGYFVLLNGTPMKAMLWRALGVRVGRRLFDDGATIAERAFLSIGDHCVLNARTVIYCHSQENDAFKSDRVVIGSGVTVGVGGFIHYGTQLGDDSVLEADSFLMKGEEMPPNTRWGGNPASELALVPLTNNTSRRKS